MSSSDNQRSAFLNGEADRYFERNPCDMQAMLDDPWNQRLASLLPPAGRVLEIGCADGRRLAAIAELADNPPNLLCGVDPSKAAISAGAIRWPHLNLEVGTADDVPFDGQFDLVLYGFCLYLCDRSLLHRAVSEGDRLTADRGALAIIDFDPKVPTKRPYHHLPGMWSFKMNYPALFLADPSYSLSDKLPASHAGSGWVPNENDRIALWVLRKSREEAYRPSVAGEPD